VLAPFSSDFIDRLVSWPRTAPELQWWFGLTGVEATDRKLFEEWQTEADSDAYLLMEGDLPVAYGELWNEPGKAELAHLMVDPARQGQGLGVTLVHELSALAAKDRPTQVFLRVQPDNAVAIRCYLRAGYERMSPEEETEFNAAQPRSYTWMRPG
jgi:[ribosomal protein S18]-alanine N-acetyltransferase